MSQQYRLRGRQWGRTAVTGSKILVLLPGATTLAACSPYVYTQEISGFSNGVDAVVSSYQTGRQAVETIIVQQRQAADIAARTRLILLPGCDQRDPSGTPPKLPDCAVAPFGATTAPLPTAVQKGLTDAAPAFGALKAYAASLAAVTTAADETALNQAAQSLTAASSGLVGAVAELAPAAAPASSLITPVGNLIGQGVSLYLDQRRYAALRSTVPTVDPAVRALAQTVEAALRAIRARQLAQLLRELHSDAEPLEIASVAKLSQGDYQSKLATLESKVTAFNEARAADPAATVTMMVNAHRQLAQALQDNTGQGMAVLTTVQGFATAAGQLKTAIDAASDATVRK
jgi:hypothetical protein